MADGIRILLVDDEPLVLRSIQKTLLRAGFQVETAENVAAALETFQTVHPNTPFDAAVLDLNMPNLEGRDDPGAGLELLSRLLAIDPDLPVVVLSAFDEVGRAREAVTRGARAYFVKGRESGLIDIVTRVVNTHSEEN